MGLKVHVKNLRQKQRQLGEGIKRQKMSKRANEGEISREKNKKLKKERSVDEAKTETVNKIIEQIKVLEDPVEDEDSTDG